MSTVKQGTLFDLEPEDLKPRQAVLSPKEKQAERLARLAERDAMIAVALASQKSREKLDDASDHSEVTS